MNQPEYGCHYCSTLTPLSLVVRDTAGHSFCSWRCRNLFAILNKQNTKTQNATHNRKHTPKS